MSISETGLAIAELKELSGLSWSGLADALGASSGDYVRKVASGARPGNNLAANVATLLQGREVQAAVPRRVTKSGKVAKVRQSAKKGAPSARPGANVLHAKTGARRIFQSANGKYGYVVATGDPETPEGAAQFRKSLASIGRGRRRFMLKVEVEDPTHPRGKRVVELGSKGGYVAANVRAGIKNEGSIYDWLVSQSPSSHLSSASLLAGNKIMSIELVVM